MSIGGALTLWTVRLAVAGYFIGAALRAEPGPIGRSVARAAWTAGCILYLAHVVCAFHFYHHWSHAAAWQHTAERTSELSGWKWGGGIYFNYAFTLVWLADTLRWWLVGGRPMPRWLAVVTQAFLWFMVFNATVVFGHGAIRWFGLAGCGLLVALWLRRGMNR